MTPKIFNSETILTTEPSMTKSGNKGSTIREREISIPLVLLGFTNMPHLLHLSLIIAKSSFNDAATDGHPEDVEFYKTGQSRQHNQPAHSLVD